MEIKTIKAKYKDGHYEFSIPISFFDGYEVEDAETGEFLGWVDAKNHRIIKYEVKEIIHKEDEKCSK